MVFSLEEAIINMEAMGVSDVLLPFILIFTIIYAILQKVKILGDNKNFNTLIALVMALLVVFPHVTGVGPDIVGLINNSIPNVAAWVVGIVMLLILLGAFGIGFTKESGWVNTVIVIASVLIIAYIFLGAKFGKTFEFLDEGTKSALLVILIFGLIVWFITGEKKEENGSLKKIGKELQKAFK